MFGSYAVQTLTVSYSHDPAADDDIVAFVAPQPLKIVSANFMTSNNVAADATNWFTVALYNGGTGGTSTTLIAGTVGGTVGWDGQKPRNFTISNGTVAANQIVYMRYNENGTGTYGHGILTINYVLGQA